MADPREPHADHDPLLIAGLLDRDLTGVERAMAEARVATCIDCAALHADLVALSSATRDLPVPARERDFRLTVADAEGLVPMTPREPATANARRTGVMTDRPTTPHAAHDALLVASLADHSLPDAEREAAQALVVSCRDCADLHADIVALRAATLSMPTPSRPRDYTLTPDDAARLRSRWRRLVWAFGTTRDPFSRPLAVGLTTLGLAGLLVASLPTITGGIIAGSGTLSTVGAAIPPGEPLEAPGGNAGSENATGAPAVPAAAPTAASSGVKSVDAGGPIGSPGPVQAPAPASSAVSDFGADRPSSPPARGVGQGAGVTGGASPTPARLGALDSTSPDAEAAARLQLPPLAMISGAFVLVGLGLFAIRWGARRLGDG